MLAQMTLEEKVGQMIQADIASISPADLRAYKLGSILAGGGAAPGNNVRSTPQAWLDLTDAFFRASLSADSAAHAPIPILFGIDAVHGHAKIIGATIFPHNVGLGAAHDPGLIRRIGQASAGDAPTKVILKRRNWLPRMPPPWSPGCKERATRRNSWRRGAPCHRSNIFSATAPRATAGTRVSP
jgi:hypothetical protein